MTVIILWRNNKGFTLIELMAAMVITLVGLLGLLQTINLSMEHNLRNQLRDEATLIAEGWMGNLKVRAFDQISGVNRPKFSARQVPSNLRGGSFQYSVFRPCSSMGTGAKLKVRVIWNYKGTPFSHEVNSLRSNN